MKLITGGSWQGQKEWIESRKEADGTIADGMTDGPGQAGKAAGILNFQGYVRRMAEEGHKEEEILKFAEDIVSSNPNVIISMDQVGCGVVPMDPFERRYRELAGKTGQLLASLADEVYWITAGISRRIK